MIDSEPTYFIELTKREAKCLYEALCDAPLAAYSDERDVVSYVKSVLNDIVGDSPKSSIAKKLKKPALGYRVLCKSCGDYWDFGPEERKRAHEYFRANGQPCTLKHEGPGHVIIRLTKTEPEV